MWTKSSGTIPRLIVLDGRGIAMLPLLFCLLLLQSGTAWAISVGQIDDFEVGTRQEWQMGFSGATSSNMTNIANGGPAGAGDNFLQVVADGTLVAGGRLTFFNTLQWSGDYLGAGITAITLDLNNISSSQPLNLRLGFNGSGGLFTTTASVSLASDSGWTQASFSLLPADLTSVSGRSGLTGFDALATLGNVTELRLLNSASPDWTGLPVVATLGIDNVSAVPLPPAAFLFGSGLIGLCMWRRII